MNPFSTAGILCGGPRRLGRGAYSFSPHPELRIPGRLYRKDAARMPRPLRAAPMWMLGLELLLGKVAVGGWAAS